MIQRCKQDLANTRFQHPHKRLYDIFFLSISLLFFI